MQAHDLHYLVFWFRKGLRYEIAKIWFGFGRGSGLEIRDAVPWDREGVLTTLHKGNRDTPICRVRYGMYVSEDSTHKQYDRFSMDA